MRALKKTKVKQGEVTPGIPAAEYERRRRQLVESLPDGSLVVCMAGHVKFMSAGERHILHLDLGHTSCTVLIPDHP